MGVDFIKRTKKSFKKGLDRSRTELGTPKLFSRDPDQQPRSYKATIRGGRAVCADEKVGVRLLEGDKVVAVDGLDVVAEMASPSDELLEALRESHGEACGTVLAVHEMAAVAEIEVS